MWRAGTDTLELVLADSGPGIPDAERARVRERFYRLPGTAPPGSGLGLAIVDELAISIGARLDLGTSDLGGLEPRVTLPNGGASPSDTSVGSCHRAGTRRPAALQRR